MRERPYFKMFACDWLTSVSVTLMTNEQRGAYMHLLAIMWTQEACGLPTSVEHLLNICSWKNDLETFQVVLAQFIPHPTEPTLLTHPRLLAQAIEHSERTELCIKAGKKSAKARRKLTGTDVQRMFNRRSTDVQRTFNGCSTGVQPEGEQEGSVPSSLHSSPSLSLNSSLNLSLNSSEEKKETEGEGKSLTAKGKVPVTRAEKLAELDALTVTEELRAWAMEQFGVTIPDEVLAEFKAHWRKQLKLRDDWKATFKMRVRQLVGWKTLVPAKVPGAGLALVPPQKKCEFSRKGEPCDEYAVAGSRFCKTHKTFYATIVKQKAEQIHGGAPAGSHALGLSEEIAPS